MSLRSSVFRRDTTWESYKNLLNEVKIWARWKDELPHDLACRVYQMMDKHARPPYAGLETAFYAYFDEVHTPLLVEEHLRRANRRW